MAEDVKIDEIITASLSNLNNRQFGFETANDADLGWKMAGGKNNSGEISLFLAKDKAARVTTLSATSDVTIVSGAITIDSLSLSTAQSYQVMYGDFQQATTFKWQSSMLRIGSTNAPEYLVDIESTTQNNFRLENSNNNAESPLLLLEKTTASPADDDGCGKITFRGTNDDPSVPEVDYIDIEAFAADVSSNDLNGTLKIKTMVNGTQTDTLTLQDGGLIIKEEATQTTDAFRVDDSSGNELFRVWSSGHLTNVDGINTVSSEQGISLYCHNYGEGAPDHTNGVGSYDHTGGTYEKLFTKTSGDDFTQNDADTGSFIVLIGGADAGRVAEIKTYVDADNVEVNGFGWSGDISSQPFYIYKHPTFVVGDGDITEVTAGSSGKFEIYSYNFTGDYVSEIKLDSASDNIDALLLKVESNGYDQNNAINIQHNVGDLQPGDLSHSLQIQLDETGATSADSTTDLQAIRLETTDSSSAKKCGICVGPGFDNVLSISGSDPADPDYGYTVLSASVVDRVNITSPDGDDTFINTSDDVALFATVNDYFLIGDDSTFEIININLATNGSQDSQLTFYYSKAGGGWTQFFPSDGTSGLTNSGNISFSAPGDWTKDDEAEANGDITEAYYIKIVRTKLGTYTYPVEDFFKIYASQDTGMKLRGDGSINPPTIADASAENNSLYYSSDQSKLVYKDSGGTVRDLW